MKPIKLKTDLVEMESRGRAKWVLRIGSPGAGSMMHVVREWSREPSFKTRQNALSEVLRIAETLQQIEKGE